MGDEGLMETGGSSSAFFVTGLPTVPMGA